MAFIKGFLFFIIMVLLVYGVTGLTAKESIVFTAFGFGISAILCSFIGIMVVLVVTMCLFAFEELGALPRLFGAQIILIALWNLIFTVVLPDEKARTILGFDLYNISSYLLYGMTVLLGIGSVAMLFNKNNY
ncbi:hypothetical protein AAFM39_24945 [Klebsiella pneumoniae]|uniref:hypothetical protein n=1 Tax=Klebsiella pneumoniae TaxID=573 RepID=UPI00313A3339